MIAINGVPLNQVEKDNPFRKLYEEGCALLKKEKAYVLKFVPALMTKKDPLEPQSKDEFPKGVTFRATQRYVTEAGECEFTWYTNSSRKKDSLEFIPMHVDFATVTTIKTDSDLDYAFFMIMVSPNCQADPRFEKYQNTRRDLSSTYYIENRAAEEKAKAEYERLVTKVRNYFYDEEKALSDKAIVALAESYGMAVTEDTIMDEVRNMVAGKAMKIKPDMSYDVNELKKFVEMVEEHVGDGSKMVDVDKDAVSNAIDTGKVVKEKNDDGDPTYYLVSGDKKIPVVTPTLGKGKHIDQLIEAFGKQPELYNQIIE